VEIWEENPFYWARNGAPILLLGGSDEDNLFNHPQLWHNLDMLQACGGNYVRCTMSSRDEGNVKPYRTDGELYDLDQFNPEYWSRFEEFLKLAHERDIVVQIEIWATYDYCIGGGQWKGRFWGENPFNPALNRNYAGETTRLLSEWDEPADRRAKRTQPFFHSVPALNNDRVLLTYQQAFVRRILDATQDYDHVLYCIDNETWALPDWSWYWAAFIEKEGVRRGVQLQVTEMWRERDIRTAQTLGSLLRPDIFSYLDISQNNRQDGQTHYNYLTWMRDKVLATGTGPRPITNVKVYSEKTHGWSKQLSAQAGPRPDIPSHVDPYWDPQGRDRLFDPTLGQDRFWKNIFAGCASTRFHRPPAGIGLNEAAQATIRAARVFTDSLDVFRCAPHPELLSKRDDDEAYCLADPGRVYGLYFPRGGEVLLHGEGGPFFLAWFDPETASFEGNIPVGSGAIRLRTPDTSQPWLALLEAENCPRTETAR
jgi:hypothetical protein